MIELKRYTQEYQQETVARIDNFVKEHVRLFNTKANLTQRLTQSIEILNEWTAPGRELYMILKDGQTVGFLHINFRVRGNAWMEDIYVDPEQRQSGVATLAIKQAETMVRQRSDCQNICLDVVPRNTAALRLYQKLGYNKISRITISKQLQPGSDTSLQSEEFVGLDFKI